MRSILVLAIFAVATLAVGPPAAAGHCSGWTTSTTSGTTVVVGGGGYYTVVEANFPPTRLYQEANSIAGLQRADSTRNDTCHGQIQADQLIV